MLKESLPMSEKRAPQSGSESRRKRVWEIDKYHKCPLIGICLTVGESRKLVKKAGFPAKKMSAYELHHTVMTHLDKENRVSGKVDKYLAYKFRNEWPSLEGDE